MPDLTRHQQLLMYLRQTFCNGNAADLARRIEKDGTYVNRLFYPPGKKGGKGVGQEIMTACTESFKLQRGFWESDPSEWTATKRPTIDDNTPTQNPNQPNEPAEITPQNSINHAGLDTPYGWPFGQRIKPWEYNTLNADEKQDIERHIKAFIRAKDPPAEQTSPANMGLTGTHS